MRTTKQIKEKIFAFAEKDCLSLIGEDLNLKEINLMIKRSEKVTELLKEYRDALIREAK